MRFKPLKFLLMVRRKGVRFNRRLKIEEIVGDNLLKIDNCIELKLNEKYLLKIEISQVTSLK